MRVSVGVILGGLLVLFLGNILWGIFAPMIVDGVDDLNTSTKVQDCSQCQTMLEKVPLFTILGYFFWTILGLLGIGVGGVMAFKGR